MLYTLKLPEKEIDILITALNSSVVADEVAEQLTHYILDAKETQERLKKGNEKILK